MKKVFIFCCLLSTFLFGKSTIGVAKNERFGYMVKVEVEMDENAKIIDIIVLENNTSKRISRKNIPKLIEGIKANNSTEGIDTVSGATYTTGLFLKAVDDALNNKNGG